jgi:3-hydroxyisobutyrate dehydrogenase
MGVRMLELPVTGGVHLAARARSPCWRAGDRGPLRPALPGAAGDGQPDLPHGAAWVAAIIKVITNMLAFIHLKATPRR